MKAFLMITAVTVAAMLLAWFALAAISGNDAINPVTVQMLTPIPNSTVSNTITLTVDASSLAGPIARVDFFVDGAKFDSVTNLETRPTAPSHVEVNP